MSNIEENGKGPEEDPDKVPALVPVPPVPAKAEDWEANLKIKVPMSLNNRAHEIFKRLCENEKFLSYINAAYDEEAVEGNTIADQLQAAEMIRDEARKMGDVVVMKSNLWALRKALRVVLDRYAMLPEQRRRRLGDTKAVEGVSSFDPDKNGN